MSFLSEVLLSAGKMDLDQINAKVPEVIAAVDSYKKEVSTYFENVNVRFKERPKQNQVQSSRINQLKDEVASMLDKCRELNPKQELLQSEVNLQSYMSSLEKTNAAILIISNLIKIHEQILNIKSLQETDSYLECMKVITNTKNHIKNVPQDEYLPILQQLSVNVDIEKNVLLNKLSNVFKDDVVMSSDENHACFRVGVGTASIKQSLEALYLHNTSITVLDQVTKFIWNNVFVSVVDFCTEIRVKKEEDFNVLEIVVQSKTTADYKEVFSNVKTVLKFMSENFNFKLSDGFTTMAYIGQDIRDNLSELIIKHCLQNTIPSTEEGLRSYNIVIQDTEDLENALIESGIFAGDTVSLLEYANNIDVLFINKKCHNYLLAAQALMKKDLHDMEEVGVAEDPQKTLEFTEAFPKCSISKSVLELIKLGEKILTEASQASDVCAGRLFCTVKNIFEKYSTFIPEYHKKLLQTIPQQVGLFYNNCSYIAHKFTDWNEMYMKKLPSVLSLGPDGFRDECRQLQKVANDMFSSFVASQIKQIEDIMKESHLKDHQSLEQVDASTEKCIRQCLRQQELLKTVWHKVLPYTIYNKTLGSIMNSLCVYLIQAVVKFEDISSDGAESLVDLFKMVLTRGPKLFTDPKEVSLFVESWYTLNELVFVLNASLLDINDRWADGKGPLALQFKPEELKQLVRALFQNTERRSALLSKIRD